jgi:long-chain acyl-CoA synthetase
MSAAQGVATARNGSSVRLLPCTVILLLGSPGVNPAEILRELPAMYSQEVIAAEIMRAARAHPDRPALRERHRVWTYGELSTAIEGIARHMERLIPANEPLNVVMSRSGRAIATLLAASLHGHPAVLLPDGLHENELAQLIKTSHFHTVIGSSRLANVVNQAPGSADRVEEVEGMTWLIRSCQAGAPASPLDSNDFVCQLTSGSTGKPRFAVRTQDGALAEIHSIHRRLAMVPADRIVCGSSIAHSYGLFGGLLAPLSCGAEVTLAATPAEVSAAVARSRPSIVVGLASAYETLMNGEEPAIRDARYLLSAGAPLPAGLYRTFYQEFGAPIRQDYGTTETGTIAIDAPANSEEGCAGNPLEHVEIRLRDVSDIPLVGEEQGEIQVRSNATARGYLEGSGIVTCVDEEGWYGTRDAGYTRAGKLFVGRRLRDPIQTSGGSVRPEDVERAVGAMPGVVECVALQGRDDRDRPGVHLIVAGLDITAEDVSTWCAGHLDPAHIPARIEALDRLPRSPAGKLLMRYLV